MDWDYIAGNWKKTKGLIKEWWGELTDDDLNVIEGKKDQLLGKLQTAYGYGKHEAQKEFDEFMASVSEKNYQTRDGLGALSDK